MSTVKTKFSLHENYEDFKLSVLKQEVKNLPMPRESFGRLSLKVFLAGLMLIMGLFLLYFSAFVPFLFQNFSQATTAQVIDCEIRKTKQYGPIPNLTYTYIWNNQPFIGSEPIHGYYMDGCDAYLNQIVAILVLVPDPSQAYLITAETSHPIREDIGMIALSLIVGAAGATGSYYYLHAMVLKIRAKINYRQPKQGILLEGEKGPKAYIITIVYGFESHKKYLTGHAKARRDDLRDTPLPPIGTPVSVLYADDHSHMML